MKRMISKKREGIFIIRITSILVLIAPLFCLASFAQLNSGPWPMFHANPQHTGQSAYAGPRTGTLSWSYGTGGFVSSSPAIGSDGRVYIGPCRNMIHAFNSIGYLIWSYKTGAGVYFSSSPAIGSDDEVYVGSEDNRIYGIASSGALLWSYQTGDYVRSSPAIESDGTIYIGSDDARIYAINSTASLFWSYRVGTYVLSSPAISSDGKVIVGAGHDVYALNSLGTLAWVYGTLGDVCSSPAIGSDGTIYVGSFDNCIYGLISDGSLLWSYRTGNEYYHGVFSSPAIGSDGRVCVGSYDYKLYVLNSNGALSWSYNTEGMISSSPAIGSDGIVYVMSEPGDIYCINSDGSILWGDYIEAGGSVSSSLAIGYDGKVYVGSNSGGTILYCYEDPSPTPTGTPTIAPTVTLTPTITSTPTVTSTPTITPTPTDTPTITSTSPPTSTPTPVVQLIPNRTEVSRGDTLVVELAINKQISGPKGLVAYLTINTPQRRWYSIVRGNGGFAIVKGIMPLATARSFSPMTMRVMNMRIPNLKPGKYTFDVAIFPKGVRMIPYWKPLALYWDEMVVTVL